MTSDAVAHGERRVNHDRRIEQSRRTLELLLDTLFRPGDWAASLAFALGLQGRVRVSTAVVAPREGSARRERPLRIAFASDFHAGSTTHPRLLTRACAALAELEPDVLLLGGDFVSVRAAYMDRLAPALASIRAPFGKFAVLGNHDLRANRTEVVSALERAGVTTLVNRSIALAAPFADVMISGLDDPTRGDPRPDWNASDTEQPTRIVLMHSPDGLHAIGERPFDVALCGHTHGGQIALPNGRPLVVPSGTLSRRFCRGVFCLGESGRTLLVSRGVGCSTIPVRLFAAPEVHLCLIT